jgi:hypothetical protein
MTRRRGILNRRNLGLDELDRLSRPLISNLLGPVDVRRDAGEGVVGVCIPVDAVGLVFLQAYEIREGFFNHGAVSFHM